MLVVSTPPVFGAIAAAAFVTAARSAIRWSAQLESSAVATTTAAAAATTTVESAAVATTTATTAVAAAAESAAVAARVGRGSGDVREAAAIAARAHALLEVKADPAPPLAAAAAAVGATAGGRDDRPRLGAGGALVRRGELALRARAHRIPEGGRERQKHAATHARTRRVRGVG